jgi:hypothetical protein
MVYEWRRSGIRPKQDSMRKEPAGRFDDNLRPEYDLSKLKGGVRGKYYQRAKGGTNLVLIEPDLARAFPDEKSVNRALRLLLTAANAATPSSRRRVGEPNTRLKRSAGKHRRSATRR